MFTLLGHPVQQRTCLALSERLTQMFVVWISDYCLCESTILLVEFVSVLYDQLKHQRYAQHTATEIG